MFLVVPTAIFLSVINKIYTKIYIKETDPFTMLFVTNLILSLFLLPFFIFNFDKVYDISMFGFGVIIFTCLLWTLNGFLGNYSYKVAPLSVREPISQMQIVFAVLIGVLVFNESPTWLDFIGIFLIIFAGLMLSFGRRVDKSEINFWIIGSILLMSFITAITSAFDKYTLNFVDPNMYLFFNFTISNIGLIIFLNKSRWHNVKNTFKNRTRFKEMFLLSVFFGGSFYLTLVAYKNFDFSIVYPILKVSAPLTAILGIFLLGEKNNWKVKILSICIAICGVILIKLF